MTSGKIPWHMLPCAVLSTQTGFLLPRTCTEHWILCLQILISPVEKATLNESLLYLTAPKVLNKLSTLRHMLCNKIWACKQHSQFSQMRFTPTLSSRMHTHWADRFARLPGIDQGCRSCWFTAVITTTDWLVVKWLVNSFLQCYLIVLMNMLPTLEVWECPDHAECSGSGNHWWKFVQKRDYLSAPHGKPMLTWNDNRQGSNLDLCCPILQCCSRQLPTMIWRFYHVPGSDVISIEHLELHQDVR